MRSESLIIFRKARKRCIEEAKNATEAEKDYYRLKMAVDFVCNMTDGYAKKFMIHYSLKI